MGMCAFPLPLCCMQASTEACAALEASCGPHTTPRTSARLTDIPASKWGCSTTPHAQPALVAPHALMPATSTRVCHRAHCARSRACLSRGLEVPHNHTSPLSTVPAVLPSPPHGASTHPLSAASTHMHHTWRGQQSTAPNKHVPHSLQACRLWCLPSFCVLCCTVHQVKCVLLFLLLSCQPHVSCCCASHLQFPAVSLQPVP